MRNALIITTDYYPYPSSNTNCFEPLLEKMAKSGYVIDIVTRRMNKRDLPYEKPIENINVYRIDDTRVINTFRVNEWANSANNGAERLLRKLIAFISKSVYYTIFCLSRKEKRFSGWRKRKAINKCIALIGQKSYDVIISVSHPVITHHIAREVKKKAGNAVWLIYEFDPFCYNKTIYGRNSEKKFFPLQCEFYDACNGILLIPELYWFYQNTPFAKYKNKMLSVPFPNMKKIEVNESNARELHIPDDKCNCIFAGALLPCIRHPGFALKVFSVCDTKKIHFTIITGSSLKFLKNELQNVNSNITIYPVQNIDTVYAVMRRSDILVNIGNTVTFQTPGKIFEYMAMGKPIIHFCKTPEDPCLRYFADYPWVLIIKEYEPDPAVHSKSIEKFCKEYAGKHMNYEEVLEYIPHLASEYVTEKFVSDMNFIVERKANNRE